MFDNMTNPANGEIIKIAKGNSPASYDYTQAYIHVIKKNVTYRTLKVLSLDISRDYDKNIADEITIEVMLSPGIWADMIYPYIDDIEITVQKSPSAISTYQTIQRYKGYCKNPINVRKVMAIAQNASTEDLNKMDVIKIDFQLVPVLVEKLLTIQAGTNFVDCRVDEAMTTMLMNEGSKIEGLDNQDTLQGIDIVEPDNQDTYRNIPVPHTTRLINLPNYLQKFSYGVYKKGLSHYIQNGMWYIYPKFGLDRRDNKIRYVNIFVTSRDLLQHTPVTYRVEGNDLYIIGTIENESVDNNSAKLLNHGNGLRTVNLNVQDTDDAVKVDGNKALVSRGQSVNEFIVNESPNNVTYAPLAQTKTNTNVYEQVSSLEGRVGKLYSVVWNNSNPDLIKPGSIMRIHYTGENNEQLMLEGVLLKAHHYTQATGQGMTSTSYETTTGLFIFCKEY